MERKAAFPELVDSSMLSSSSCPRKFFFQYCLNLAASDKSVHLHAGGALAHALQHTRIAYYRDSKSFQESIYAGARAFFEYYGDFEPPQTGNGKFKDFVNTFAAFLSYFKEYHPASDPIQPFIKDDGTPAVEFKFAIPLPINHPETGNPIFYGGRSDLIGVYNSMNAIVDEKTTYAFSDNWSQQFQLRGQFIGYVWAAQQSGMDVNCAIARGIGIQASSIKHQEAIMFYPQWQIDRWYDQMLRKVENLIAEYTICRDQDWDLNSLTMSYGDACTAYNGCEMHDLCTAENPENWFSTFKDRDWDPLA